MNTTLFECHGHLMMDGGDFFESKRRHSDGVDESAVRAALSALQAVGVRYFRDGGDALGVSTYAAILAPEYGIRYITPGFAIHRKGRYGGIVGRGYETHDEFKALIREIPANGGSFIKIMLSGILTFKEYGGLSCPGLPADEIHELIQISHEAGFPVMVHVDGDEECRAAILAGVDSIEHGYFMSDETLHILADSDTVWVPTLAAIEAFIGRDGFDPGITSETLSRQQDALQRAASYGAKIACGSDSGAVGVPHGPGTLAELRLLREAGLTDDLINFGNTQILRLFFDISRSHIYQKKQQT